MILHTIKKIAFFVVFVATKTALGQVRLPKLISDGMVLQPDARVILWGWAAAGEKKDNK